jgi:hypothetical protein
MQRVHAQSNPQAKYEEYTEALSVFNDALLNEACRPLADPPASSCENETNTESSGINPIYLALHKKCKLASNVIKRYESIPGFLKSYTLSSKWPGPRRLSNAMSQSMSGPSSGVKRSNFRPGGKVPINQVKIPSANSANSSVSSSARKRSLTPTLEVTSSDRATAPPQAAIKFLKALNSGSVSNGSTRKRMKHDMNLKDSSSYNDKEFNDKDDTSSSSRSEQEEISEMAGSTTENDSIQRDPLLDQQERQRENDDSKIQPEAISNKLDSTGMIFDVGDEVLCYYESDQKWYECIVRNVHREIVHGKTKTEDDPHTVVNVSPKRLSRNKNKTDQQIVTIVGYDVEYDDGTGEEFVEPERIKDR